MGRTAHDKAVFPFLEGSTQCPQFSYDSRDTVRFLHPQLASVAHQSLTLSLGSSDGQDRKLVDHTYHDLATYLYTSQFA